MPDLKFGIILDVKRLVDLAEAGATHFILVPLVRNGGDFMPQIEGYAKETVPRMQA